MNSFKKILCLCVTMTAASGCGKWNKVKESPSEGPQPNPTYTFPMASLELFRDVVEACHPNSSLLPVFKSSLADAASHLTNLAAPNGTVEIEVNGSKEFPVKYEVFDDRYWKIEREALGHSRAQKFHSFSMGLQNRSEGLISEGGQYLIQPGEYASFGAHEKLVIDEYKDAKNWSATYDSGEFIGKTEHHDATSKEERSICTSVDGVVNVR